MVLVATGFSVRTASAGLLYSARLAVSVGLVAVLPATGVLLSSLVPLTAVVCLSAVLTCPVLFTAEAAGTSLDSWPVLEVCSRDLTLLPLPLMRSSLEDTPA